MTTPPTGKGTWKLFIVVFVVCFGANFQIFNVSVVNNPQVFVEAWINATYYHRYDRILSSETLDVIISMIVASCYLGAAIGSLFTGLCAEKLGRKRSLLLLSFISVIGALFAGLAKKSGYFELLFVGRLLLGLSMGIGFGIAAMFITEIPPIRLRGSCATVQQLLVGFADFFSLTITLPEILGTEELWPLPFGFPLVPAGLLLLVLPFCPESPRYAYITLGDRKEAERAIEFYQGKEAVENALYELETERRAIEGMKNVRAVEILRHYRFRKPLIISLVVAMGIQMSGIAPVMAYSTSMFTDAHLSVRTAKFATSGIGLVNFILPIGIIYIIERTGRRTLTLTGYMGCLISLCCMTIFTGIGQHIASAQWTSYLAIASLIGYQASFAIGAPMVWFITCELFNQSARSTATTMVNFCLWSAALMNTLAYLPFKGAVGVSYSFLPYIVCMIFVLLYLYQSQPETKGRRIQSITEKFVKLSKKSKKQQPVKAGQMYAKQISTIENGQIGSAASEHVEKF